MNFVDDPESAVLAAAKDMLRRGLVEGTAGNISARRSDGNVVITPSSVDYAEMLLHDLVLVDAGGAVLHAKDGRSPSTELNLHLACYRAFDDIGSVIHSHPVWATMFAVAHEPIPACIEPMPCSPRWNVGMRSQTPSWRPPTRPPPSRRS